MDILDKMREGGVPDRSDLNRLRNILRGMQNITLDWVRLYHGERDSVVQELESRNQRIAELREVIQRLKNEQ